MPRASEPRSKILKIRLKEAEFEDFKSTAKSKDLAMSDLARSMLIGVAPQVHRRRFVFHPVDPALLRQLAAIGNNLNQIASWANTEKSRANAQTVLIALVSVERAVSELLRENTRSDVPSDRQC